LHRDVEPADAAESRRHRNRGAGEVRRVEQLLREVQPLRVEHRVWSCADVLQEEPVQVPRADAEP
jgi:hypothetical protein